MTMLDGFEPVAELAADERGRITFGRLLEGFSHFAVAKNAEGQILLTPVANIHARELVIWGDPALRESLLRGMADASHGRVSTREDFLDAGEDDRV